MAKVNRPCLVPECKGRLEAGMREGKLVEWCPVCERRIHQLKALHAKLAEGQTQREAPPASGPLSDEAVIALLPKRFMTASQTVRTLKKSSNLVSDAIKRGEIRHVRLGRFMLLVSRASAKAWADGYRRRTPEGKRTAAIVAALPRTPEAAASLEQLAAATKLRAANVSEWTRTHAARPELKRRADIAKNGRPILLFWWQEVPRA